MITVQKWIIETESDFCVVSKIELYNIYQYIVRNITTDKVFNFNSQFYLSFCKKQTGNFLGAFDQNLQSILPKTPVKISQFL
jgi:hypothetical protein